MGIIFSLEYCGSGLCAYSIEMEKWWTQYFYEWSEINSIQKWIIYLHDANDRFLYSLVFLIISDEFSEILSVKIVGNNKRVREVGCDDEHFNYILRPTIR